MCIRDRYGTELSYTQRKILVRTRLASVDLAVVRTVHWLEHIPVSYTHLVLFTRLVSRLTVRFSLTSL